MLWDGGGGGGVDSPPPSTPQARVALWAWVFCLHLLARALSLPHAIDDGYYFIFSSAAAGALSSVILYKVRKQ